MGWLDVKKIMKAERSVKWVTWRTPASGRGYGSIAEAEAVAAQPPGKDRRELIPEIGFREYWWPAAEARKVPKRRPLGLRLVGEDIVLFRGSNGEINTLWNVCAHRGGSLADGHCHYDGTVSCPYHGWTYDGTGEVVTVLSEGPASMIPGKVSIKSFPTKTLPGMVFVWMGDGEPAPIEEDVPPEFFHDRGVVFYTTEYWPLNWRLALENALDSHAAYLHRDSALALLVPMRISGPTATRPEIVNNRSATRPRMGRGSLGAIIKPKESANGNSSAPAARQVQEYRQFHPAVDGWWPKTRWRYLWKWATAWGNRRRYGRKPPVETNPEWAGVLQHLPSMVRLDYHTHVYTRCSIPVDKDLTREIYFHYAPSKNWLAKTYEWLQFNLFHDWAMMANFSQQDLSASAPQRYDTREYLSSTDAQLVSWRKLLMKARGIDHVAVEALPRQASEEFYSDRMEEAGLGAEPEKEQAEPVQGG